MKKILYILLLFIVPNVSAIELFTTDLNITVDSINKTLKINAEDDCYFSTTTNVSASHNFKVYLYRETELREEMDNLTDFCNSIKNLYYDNLVGSINKMNQSLSGMDYYADYSECYWSKDGVNQSLQLCDQDKSECITNSEKCIKERDDYKTQRDNYKNNYEKCGVGDNSELKTCQEERDSYSGRLWIGLIIGAIIGAVICYFVLKGKIPQRKVDSPLDDIGDMEM